MPDNPSPHGPHTHLYQAHYLDRARHVAALESPQAAAVIVCVLCGAGDTLDDDHGPPPACVQRR